MRRAPLLALMFLVMSCGPQLSHGGPIRDHVSFVDALRARRVLVEIAGPTDVTAAMKGYGTGLVLTGEGMTQVSIDSYNYDPTDLGDATAAADADMQTLRGSGAVRMHFPGPYHAYRKERLIVLYIGDDSAAKRLFTELLGSQFAGTP